MGAAEGGPRVFSLLAFLGWAEGCLLPTVSPRAELCLKVVVRAPGKAVVTRLTRASCPVTTLCKIRCAPGPALAGTCVPVRGPPPRALTCLVEAGVESVHCLNACFLCFPFTKGFSLGLFLVRLALILKML